MSQYFLAVIALLFITGTVFGSFLSVLIDRLSTERSPIGGRSYCEHCKRTLSFQDLIPIFSYIFLQGKCRFCKARIPSRLFVVEILSGCLFLILGYMFVNYIISLFVMVTLVIILWCFLGIFFADIVYGIIPDLLVLISTVGTIFYLYFNHFSILEHILSGLGALLFFLLLFGITKGRGMGFGDVKLSFVLGFLLGFPNIITALYIAFLTGAMVSIILVICKKLHFFGSTIPFGPFLILGTIISLFWGNLIIQIFLTHFLQ